jgi:hypothetical protein
MKTLNAMTITWAIITPINNKPTKSDLKTINKSHANGGFVISGTEIIRHFASKEAAIESVKKISGLSKAHKVVFITDKQFGLSEYGQPFVNVATKKQLIDTTVII